MFSDIEIARAAKLKPIADIAARIRVPESALDPYGRWIAKLDPEFVESLDRPDGKLILVTAISPTRAVVGATMNASNGTSAPSANDAADTQAACNGRAAESGC